MSMLSLHELLIAATQVLAEAELLVADGVPLDTPIEHINAWINAQEVGTQEARSIILLQMMHRSNTRLQQNIQEIRVRVRNHSKTELATERVHRVQNRRE